MTSEETHDFLTHQLWLCLMFSYPWDPGRRMTCMGKKYFVQIIHLLYSAFLLGSRETRNWVGQRLILLLKTSQCCLYVASWLSG